MISSSSFEMYLLPAKVKMLSIPLHFIIYIWIFPKAHWNGVYPHHTFVFFPPLLLSVFLCPCLSVVHLVIYSFCPSQQFWIIFPCLWSIGICLSMFFCSCQSFIHSIFCPFLLLLSNITTTFHLFCFWPSSAHYYCLSHECFCLCPSLLLLFFIAASVLRCCFRPSSVH